MSYEPTPEQLRRLQDFRNDIKTACVRHGFVLRAADVSGGAILIEGYDQGVLDTLVSSETGFAKRHGATEG